MPVMSSTIRLAESYEVEYSRKGKAAVRYLSVQREKRGEQSHLAAEVGQQGCPREGDAPAAALRHYAGPSPCVHFLTCQRYEGR